MTVPRIPRFGQHHRVLYIREMSDNTPEQNFAALGLTLPPAPAPMGVYKPGLIDGNHFYVSGHGPLQKDGTLIVGRIGEELDIEKGKAAALQVGLAIVATIKATLGNLDRVKRVIKVFGMVGCTPEFDRHPYVINGCSELFAKIWGEDNGIGVRSAVGMGSLPGNIPVEIEALFELN
jgi:enamine deaminase RidA (YjgF/YER057c/UK114 family)